MVIIHHRVNSIAQLRGVSPKYGVEIDVRHDNRTGGLYLNHDPGEGDDLEEYLQEFKHALIIFNVKESGIEDLCIAMAKKHGIPSENFFVLDAEFPWIYQAARKGVRSIAIRYSEAEPIEQLLQYKDKVDWAWIDTNTRLPLDEKVVRQLRGVRTCLVCPDRWGRPEDIPAYIKTLMQLDFRLDAVMTAPEYVDTWESSGVVTKSL